MARSRVAPDCPDARGWRHACSATNTDPKLPWHRVLRSDGRIAFPEGSKNFREQSQRLRAEGVVVSNGRVRMPSRERSLDAMIWGHD